MVRIAALRMFSSQCLASVLLGMETPRLVSRVCGPSLENTAVASFRDLGRPKKAQLNEADGMPRALARIVRPGLAMHALQHRT